MTKTATYPLALAKALDRSDPFAMRLARMHTLGTYKNTAFIPWWEKLNDLLAKNGLPEYLFRDAHDAYEVGQTPATELAEAMARRA